MRIVWIAVLVEVNTGDEKRRVLYSTVLCWRCVMWTSFDKLRLMPPASAACLVPSAFYGFFAAAEHRHFKNN